MRIAFTSCFSAKLFPEQPVWKEIANAQPDVLVLLGDSIYLDQAPGLIPGVAHSLSPHGLQALDAAAFAEHAHRLYQLQLEQEQFKALIAKMNLRTYAIWDDHDFLWNNACGADIMGGALEQLVYPSRALFAAWCDALQGKPFPEKPPAFDQATRPPGYRHVDLGLNVHLHLTDGRTWRAGDDSALLGMEQLAAIERQMEQTGPGATHLLASGSVVERRTREAWVHCGAEYEQLHRIAAKHNILVLSGDVHDNQLCAYRLDGGRNLFEATASGAALRTLVHFGSLQRNYGLLDIDAENLHIQVFKSNTVPQFRGTIDRQHWT
jgi:phosphodiesterase/alkaline phosphatase D-like protein